MEGVRRDVISGVLGFAILLAGVSRPAAEQAGSPADGQLVLTGATIYPGPTDSPLSKGVVVIRDGKIAAVGRRRSVRIPKDAATLDCSGLTITAGFWNSHVHFFERKWADAANLPATEVAGQLEAMLTRYGFTSVFDLGSPWDNTRRIRERIESGEIPGPRIRSTGEGLSGKGWLPLEMGFMLRVLGVMQTESLEVEDAAGALAASKKLLDGGADGLKLHAASQFPPHATLPDEVIETAVKEAHRRNKPIFAHPTSRDGLLAAVRGGVDIVAHTTPPSGPWDEAVVGAMRQAKVALIPTLKIWIHHLRHDRASLSVERARIITGQLRAWLASGGVVLFGTDVGGMDDYDPSDEYALMAEAGMTFRQILASLTTAPAETFGESGRLGRIAPGLAADLVVLTGDLSRDARAFATVRYTIVNGKLIYQCAR
ncbi:MAG: amidohydrolase family protein [Acidobacteria bacterium]|nr:amidohydrolase family protein [Acidobacteriota bacterium]